MKIQPTLPSFIPRSKPQAKESTQAPSTATDLWNDGRPWDSRNQPARLIAQDKDSRTLSGFRWGFTETPKLDDWKPQFQNTKIDINKLKDVHFYIEHFFPAGHGALVFEFEDGAVQGADGLLSNKMVYSIEARKKEGDTWTAQRGFQKTMGIVHQLMTFEDATQWVTRRQGASFETRRLSLEPEEKKRLLETCLTEAVQDRTGEYYHTTRNSCYSALQKVMNKALPQRQVGLKSALSLGLLMRPEAVMTSAYNTVIKRMGAHSGENARLYLADPQAHPVKHAEQLEKLSSSSWLKSLASQSWFPAVARASGALIGAGLGQALTENLLVAATVGYVGYHTGAIGGDLLEGNARRTVMNT